MPQILPRLGLTGVPSVPGRPCVFTDKGYNASRHAPMEIGPSAAGNRAPGAEIDRQEVKDLVAVALAPEAEATRRYLRQAASRHTVESLCEGLLAAAARELGVMWDEDACSFAEVTIGLLRLQQALQELAPTFVPGHVGGAARRHILLALVPGESHSFGLTMVQGFFSRAGWQVTPGIGRTLPELVSQVSETWYGIIGLSAGCEKNLGLLAQCIRQLRRASRNRQVAIMVGGPVFALHPDRAAGLGADAMAADGLHAIQQAENLLGLRLGAD
jgi:methanogenic corrinoid protein MtbC1